MLLDLSIRSGSRAVKYFSQFTSKQISNMVNETRHLKTGDPEPTFPSDGKLQLISMRFCPYAQRTHIILEAKRIPYHTFNINLVDKPEWLTKYSLLGKVPALGVPTENGLRFIHESMVIADYLDEKYPEKLLYPKDPLAKAVDRLLIERFSNVSTAFYKIGVRQDVTGKIELTNALDEFETELKKRGTSFFGGKEPGMLDYMIWPWMERLPLLKYGKDVQYELDQDKFSALTGWSRKMIDDYAVNVHYLTPDVHRQFLEGFISKNVDYDILVNKSKM